MNSGNNNIDEFIHNTKFNTRDNYQINDYMNSIVKYSDPSDVYESIGNINTTLYLIMEWIPYSRIKDLTEIAKGGFGIIYSATWLDGAPEYKYRTSTDVNRYNNKTVAIKRFLNSKDISKYFLNEVIT